MPLGKKEKFKLSATLGLWIGQLEHFFQHRVKLTTPEKQVKTF